MPRSLLIALLLLAVASTATVIAFRFDQPIRDEIVRVQGKKWNKTAEHRFHTSVRKYGDWPWIMLLGAVGLALAWKLNNRRWMQILAAAMIASTLAGIIANASRLTTGRTRPRESPKIAQGFYGPWHNGRLTIGDPPYNSFPSGHTATAFGFAGVIVMASPAVGIVALVGAGMIAWSSIIVGVHHPSDVTVSICLSLVVAWFTWRWMKTKGDKAWEAAIRRFRGPPKE